MRRATDCLVVVGMMAALPTVVCGQSCDPSASFAGPESFETPFETTSAVMADLDGDGASDLVITDGSAETIEVMLGDGAGGFGPPSVYAVGDGLAGVAIGDLDGDGVPDVLAASWRSNSVSVRLGLGDGSLGEATSFPAGTSPGYPVLGDLDGDGDLDTIVRDATGFLVLENTGDGEFAATHAIGAGDEIGLALLGDLDGDGDLDLVSNDRHNPSFYLNNGDGTFASQNMLGLVAVTTSVALGDMDGDGDLDIVGVDDGTSSIEQGYTLFRNDGAARFEARFTPMPGLGDAIVITDLDGDGDLDLATTGYHEVAATVLLNDGTGGLRRSGRYTIEWARSSVARPSPMLACEDVDGDGLPDLVTLWRGSNAGTIVRNLGEGRFASSQRFAIDAGGDEGTGLQLADLDGDGLLDVVMQLADSVGPYVYFSDPQAPGQYEPPVNLFTATYDPVVALGDFDGDGRTDVAAASQLRFRTAFNNGGRIFDVRDADLIRADLLAAGDLDGDGWTTWLLFGLALYPHTCPEATVPTPKPVANSSPLSPRIWPSSI